MNILIVSVDHFLQLIEAETDSDALLALKRSLRKLIQEHHAERKIAMIFEESLPDKLTIAGQFASQNLPAITWRNINMTDDERRAAGIFEALENRPFHLNWNNGPPPIMIQHRVDADAVREDFFVNQIIEAKGIDGEVVVLLGNMHVMPVTDKLRNLGHVVHFRDELFPIFDGNGN